MSQTIIEAPETAGAELENNAIVATANAMIVQDVAQHEVALGVLKRIAGAVKQVVDLFAEPKKAAHAAHKAITAAEGKLLDPLKSARMIVETKALIFQDAQRKLAEAQALKLAEEQRQRDMDAALADAIDAEARGDKAEAADILATEIAAPVVIVAPNVAEVAGVSDRGTWSIEVVDKKALDAYVAANSEWSNLTEPNIPVLNSLARAQKTAFRIPGVKAVFKRGLAVRA